MVEETHVVSESYVVHFVQNELVRRALAPVLVSHISSRTATMIGRLVTATYPGVGKDREPVTFKRLIADKNGPVAAQPDAPATELFVKRTLENVLHYRLRSTTT